MCGFIPVVSATPDQDPFPDIPFRIFSDFIQSQFSSEVSLATVMAILMTMTSNNDLLNLHARQQHPKVANEVRQLATGWIKALARALENRLGDTAGSLFREADHKSQLNADQVTTSIGLKLDGLSKVLNLHPYSREGCFLGKLKPVSHLAIQPVIIICPSSMECKTTSCQSRAIRRQTRDRDIPQVTLVEGTKIYDNVLALAGHCGKCQTIYHADHERVKGEDGTWMKLYLNSAKYLKVGQNIWVDQNFSGMVLNGFYHFHASASAFMEFWNQTCWKNQQTTSRRISRCQVWHAFIQESVRRVATASGFDLELPDRQVRVAVTLIFDLNYQSHRLPIAEVTAEAFKVLGEEGLIRSANNHQCSECTHPYKRTADTIPEIDPAGVVGVDENRDVPGFTGDDDAQMELGSGNSTSSSNSSSGDEAMDTDSPEDNPQSDDSSSTGDVDKMAESPKPESFICMAVMDGIVMGPKRCAFNDCVAGVANNRDGVFCAEHQALRGH